MRPIYQSVEAQNKVISKEAQSNNGNAGRDNGVFKHRDLCQIKSNSQRLMECATPNYRDENVLETMKVAPSEIKENYVSQMTLKFMKMEYDAASPSMKLILGCAAQGQPV